MAEAKRGEAVEPLNREFRIASLDPRYRIGSLVERLRQVTATLERFPPTRDRAAGFHRSMEADQSRKIRACTVNRARARAAYYETVPGHACTRANAWAMENV